MQSFVTFTFSTQPNFSTLQGTQNQPCKELKNARSTWLTSI